MITEAFVLTCNEQKSYLHIDRSYGSGGIILVSDVLKKIFDDGMDGYIYFEEFTLDKWLDALGISDGIVNLEVLKDCDNMINMHIYKDKRDDILSITIKNNTVTEITSLKGETIYTQGDDYIDGWEVGWFGKIYEYYTSQISFDITEHDSDYDYIWGVYYPS